MNADKASYKKSSFGPAFLFLDKKRRAALAVYYAFCRLMDDIADEPGVKDPLKELAFWRAEIKRVYAGAPQTDLGKDVRRIAREFAMPEDRFLQLIDGMEADVRGRRYTTFRELKWYLWRVAGVVGLATLDIVGLKGPKAEELARTLGFAVQITNIVRDVHEDAALKRVYLPDDLLAEYGLSREDVQTNSKPQALAGALRALADKSILFYDRAGQMMKELPARKTLPCRIMGCVYRANLAKIEKTDFCFAGTVKLSKFEKIVHCIYALFKTDIAH